MYNNSFHIAINNNKLHILSTKFIFCLYYHHIFLYSWSFSVVKVCETIKKQLPSLIVFHKSYSYSRINLSAYNFIRIFFTQVHCTYGITTISAVCIIYFPYTIEICIITKSNYSWEIS